LEEVVAQVIHRIYFSIFEFLIHRSYHTLLLSQISNEYEFRFAQTIRFLSQLDYVLKN